VGFASAATDFVAEFSRGSKIETEISLDLPSRLPADTEILLFRVLQESLTNIHRHSGSGRATIRAAIDGETVCLEIRDFGRGIPQEVLETFKTSTNGAGVGLTGIRERLREVDGKLELSSTTEGTTLRVNLPADNRKSPGASGGHRTAHVPSHRSSDSPLDQQSKHSRQSGRSASRG
jgi:two-component system, NarL family, sensor kinase